MRKWIVTGTSMVVEAEDEQDAVLRAEQSSGWHWEATEVDAPEVTTSVCIHCGRSIGQDADGIWMDPEATGDDSVWRETCADNHNDRVAAHEPEEG